MKIGRSKSRVRWHESSQFAFPGDELVVSLEDETEADAGGVVEVVVNDHEEVVGQVDELCWPCGGGSNCEGHSGGTVVCAV